MTPTHPATPQSVPQSVRDQLDRLCDALTVRLFLRQHPATVELLVEEAALRTARKKHYCAGEYDGVERRRSRCPLSTLGIEKGERYVEYFGEAAAYESGVRYHLTCAVSQGLVALREEPAALTSPKSALPGAGSGKEETHTATPWVVKEWAGGQTWVWSADGYVIAQIQYSDESLDEQNDANAEFIVRAVNAHEDLVAELENIANADPSTWDPEMRGQFREWAQNRARHAIAKASR